MKTSGFVTLNGEVIGSFDLSNNKTFSISLNRDNTSVVEILEFASENGMVLGLTIIPDLEDYTPKHQLDTFD